MPSPLVSVIIPLHNAEPYIAECIESVLTQTYQNVEVIVVENCSTDNSLSIAKRYECEKVRVLISDIPNASAARNVGLREAKGEYIQFLDADDILPAEKIEVQMVQIGTAGLDDRIMSFCAWKNMYDDGLYSFADELRHDYAAPVDALVEMQTSCSGILLHCYLTPKSIIEHSGYWNETLSLDDDGEFFARVLCSANRLLFNDQVIVPYRNTPNSLSKSVSRKAIDSQIRSAQVKADILRLSSLPTKETAQIKCLSRSVNYLYPYFRKERRHVEALLKSDYGIQNIEKEMDYPRRTIKEMLYYFGVRFFGFPSEFQA